ncbi:hypothetical protein J4434_00495 [Candidatus Woesearchaeota archaeon]|nr:hypothetical protein [Candidatus Woesearchaeota archaeon]
MMFRWKNLSTIFIFIFLVFSLFITACSNNNSSPYKDEPWKYDTFAKCLTEKGAVMYGTEWCKYCKAQKELFGNSFRFINYVDCEKQASKCIQDGIKGYPTWIIDGKIYSGKQEFFDLTFVTGCKLTEDVIEITDTV